MGWQSKKVIAVVGATGAQGGGLARAILADPDGGFAVRALTRNPDSDAAKALAAAGAEVVQADLDDEASLAAAFEGAYGAYCLTNFWEHFSAEKEIEQAGNMARAAKTAGIQHAIWSTFEDSRKWIPLDDDRMPTLQGRFKVAHFDGKAEADHFFTDAGVPTTFLLTSFYWENFIYFGMGPARGEDGVLAVTFPLGDAKMPGIAAEDIGKCAYGIFKAGDEFIGKTVGISGEQLTGAEFAASFTRRSARRFATTTCPPTCSGASASPGQTTSATCSSSSATRTPTTARLAASSSRARSTPTCRPSTAGSRRTRSASLWDEHGRGDDDRSRGGRRPHGQPRRRCSRRRCSSRGRSSCSGTRPTRTTSTRRCT